METTLYGTRDIIPTCARLRSGYVHLAEGPKSFEEFRLCTHEREADGTPVDHPLHAQLGTNVTVVPIRLISTDPSVNCSQALVSHDDKGRVVCRADAAGQPYTRHDGAKGCCEGPAQCAFAKEYGCSTETRLVFALKVGDEELVTSFVTHASSAADEIPRMIRMASVTAGTTPARAIQLTLRKLPRLNDRYFQSRPISDMADRAHGLQHLQACAAFQLDVQHDHVGVGGQDLSRAVGWCRGFPHDMHAVGAQHRAHTVTDDLRIVGQEDLEGGCSGLRCHACTVVSQALCRHRRPLNWRLGRVLNAARTTTVVR